MPPPGSFELIGYAGPQGRPLPAYVTPDPEDGRRRPAIVLLVGGDVNSIGEVWTPQPESNDQSRRPTATPGW